MVGIFTTRKREFDPSPTQPRRDNEKQHYCQYSTHVVVLGPLEDPDEYGQEGARGEQSIDLIRRRIVRSGFRHHGQQH